MTASAIAVWLAGEVFDLSLGEALGQVYEAPRPSRQRYPAGRTVEGEDWTADATDKDEAAAMVFGYTEAARQGAARRNLRMLAQIMAGHLSSPPIYADEFLRWSRLLSDLSQAELIILAHLHSLAETPMLKTEGVVWTEIGEKLLAALQQQSIVETKAELGGMLGALQRTGLVIYQGGGWGEGAWHLPSPLLDKLLRLVDLDAAMAEPAR